MWTRYGKMGLGMEAKTRWQLKLHTSPMLMCLNFRGYANCGQVEHLQEFVPST
jgi:hypothetical protein